MKVAQLLEQETEPLIIRLIRQRFEKGERVGRYVKQGMLGKKWEELTNTIHFSSFASGAKWEGWWIAPKQTVYGGGGRILIPDVDKWELVPHSRLKKAWVLRRRKLDEGIDPEVSADSLPLALRILVDRIEAKKPTYLFDRGIFEDAVLIYSVQVLPAGLVHERIDVEMMVEHPSTHSGTAVGYYKHNFEDADITVYPHSRVVVEMK